MLVKYGTDIVEVAVDSLRSAFLQCRVHVLSLVVKDVVKAQLFSATCIWHPSRHSPQLDSPVGADTISHVKLISSCVLIPPFSLLGVAMDPVREGCYLEFGNLSHHTPNCSCSCIYQDSFTFLRLTDVEKAKVCRRAGHAYSSQCQRGWQISYIWHW